MHGKDYHSRSCGSCCVGGAVLVAVPSVGDVGTGDLLLGERVKSHNTNDEVVNSNI